jgi:hypothetical protein
MVGTRTLGLFQGSPLFDGNHRHWRDATGQDKARLICQIAGECRSFT